MADKPAGGNRQEQTQRHAGQYRRAVLQQLEAAEGGAGEAYGLENPHVFVVRFNGAADAVAQNYQYRSQKHS